MPKKYVTDHRDMVDRSVVTSWITPDQIVIDADCYVAGMPRDKRVAII